MSVTPQTHYLRQYPKLLKLIVTQLFNKGNGKNKQKTIKSKRKHKLSPTSKLKKREGRGEENVILKLNALDCQASRL